MVDQFDEAMNAVLHDLSEEQVEELVDKAAADSEARLYALQASHLLFTRFLNETSQEDRFVESLSDAEAFAVIVAHKWMATEP
jgi:hypothetical protein